MNVRTAYRSGVGIVLFNDRGMIFMGRRGDGRTPPWQMPQGGLLPGEAPEEAVWRELHEEIGTANAAIVAHLPHWLHYDYPAQAAARRANAFRGQRHKWMLLRFLGCDEDIDIKTAHPEFVEWQWVAPSEVAERVAPFKRDVYRIVTDSFVPMIASWNKLTVSLHTAPKARDGYFGSAIPISLFER